MYSPLVMSSRAPTVSRSEESEVGNGADLTARAGSVSGDDADTQNIVIEVSGLRMAYDGFEAVRGLDLKVRRGEIFTFLGPNGAGKTTTVFAAWERGDWSRVFPPKSSTGEASCLGSRRGCPWRQPRRLLRSC
jgi:ABC-type molybdenum transport system ATPase subunit/photorepair protein PhrA